MKHGKKRVMTRQWCCFALNSFRPESTDLPVTSIATTPFQPPQSAPPARATWLAAIMIGLAATTQAENNWPAWRGDGSGISSETKLPVAWNAAENIAWKAPLPGEGKSSPIVWGEKIFLTAATDAGKKRLVICLSVRDGHVLWQREYAADKPGQSKPESGYACPSAVTDGMRVFAFFDDPGLVALDVEGNPLWQRPLGPFKNIYNMASSPVLYKDMVIVDCDHIAGSFIVAADAATGEIRWKAPRKNGLHYGTPLLIEVKGRRQLVMPGTTLVTYDPYNGKELWSWNGLTPTVIPSPVFDKGILYATSGRNGPTVAINPSGRGDLTATPFVKFYIPSGGPYVPSPIIYPTLILPCDDGMMRFIAADGSIATTYRLRGHFSASPVGAENRIYWTAESGETYVLDMSGGSDKPTVRTIAVNPLDEKVFASPAIANGKIYIRTHKNLVCIAGKGMLATAVKTRPSVDFVELKNRYESHLASSGDDVGIRIEVVESMDRVPSELAVPFLSVVVLKDISDVSEAAAKVLVQHGPAAADALLGALRDGRPFLKVLAAENLGRLKVAQAAPALAQAAKAEDRLLRIAAVDALGRISGEHIESLPRVVPALAAAMLDEDWAVKLAAVEGASAVDDRLNPSQREEIIKALTQATTDKNPQVAARAQRVFNQLSLSKTPSR